ncbi:MAG: RagB/SusD family nutrient uptake outer membrane protein [Porphyromonadaceae bacterium]|nr:RagB/SusD family nutrient uptake outer membrane protein [Porphyromonadaceae bacterium]
MIKNNHVMKYNRFIYKVGGLAIGLLPMLSACNHFLSILPDNRIDVDNDRYEKVKGLLITAYPNTGCIVAAEMSSDNVVEVSENSSYGTRFYDQLYSWEDVSEASNDAPAAIWESAYGAIQAANVALEIAEKATDQEKIRPLKGEALLCRAYGHFILTNMFAQAYDPISNKDSLGVYYMERPERKLNPKYHRQTLGENYQAIQRDIEEGLPLIRDAVYGTTPKYHFNQSAGHAFAARFYLYAQQWDKAIKYATAVLGDDPASVLRDYTPLAKLPSGETGFINRSILHVDHRAKNNLLLLTSYGRASRVFGASLVGARYNHVTYVATTETIMTSGAWGDNFTEAGTGNLKLAPAVLTPPFSKVILPRIPEQFEYTNRAAGVGYLRTTYADFTTDETLLVRAEAYIHKEKYAEALQDMNIYLRNFLKDPIELTEAKIEEWNQKTPYHTPLEPTPRKKLNANMSINTKQEHYLQVLLHMRRLETLHLGLRWMDVKRYGIEITRVTIKNGNNVTVTSNVLTKNDPRRALQLPLEVLSAGMQGNRGK